MFSPCSAKRRASDKDLPVKNDQIKLTRTGTLGLAWVFLPCGIMVISSDTFKGAFPATVGLCLGAGAAFALGAPAVLRPPLKNKISSLKLVWRIQKVAVTHLVPNPYGPPQLVPNWLVPMDKWSPTNSVSMDKWSPTNLVPLDKWSLEYYICPGGQAVGILKCGDQIGWGPFVLGDQLLFH